MTDHPQSLRDYPLFFLHCPQAVNAEKGVRVAKACLFFCALVPLLHLMSISSEFREREKLVRAIAQRKTSFSLRILITMAY
jgi:hypothetical protein